MTGSEKSMAEGIRRGDNRAMRDFIAAFGGYLTAVCSRYIADDEDVKDVMQEALIRIISNIHRFQYQGNGSLRAWATRIVVSRALDFLKQRKRTVALFADMEMAADKEFDDSPPDIDDIPAEAVTDMIRQLPEGYRMVFNLYVIEGRSHKEIAQTLGIKETTSASQLHRAKAMLARQIKDFNPQTKS